MWYSNVYMALHIPSSEKLLVGQQQYSKEKVEKFINEVMDLAIAHDLCYNEALVAVRGFHDGLLSLPSFKKLSELK